MTAAFVGKARADGRITPEALNKTKQAIMIYSGLDAKLKDIQSHYSKEVELKLESSNLKTEAAIIGVAVKTVRDKSISFNYKGTNYFITPNYLQVKFWF